MKTIGLIGGMSWESTVTYYDQINTLVKEKLGGLHSAKILLYSVDFDEIEKCQSSGEWEKSGKILAEAALNLEKADADMILICTNTMHKVYGQVADAVAVPVLHIADATIHALQQHAITKVGLLGTKYAMLQDFYTGRIREAGIEVVVPDTDGKVDEINRVIFDELCLGKILPESKKEFLQVIDEMKAAGAQGVILGCTEISLLIQQADTDLPVFDTTLIHSQVAVEKALEK